MEDNELDLTIKYGNGTTVLALECKVLTFHKKQNKRKATKEMVWSNQNLYKCATLKTEWNGQSSAEGLQRVTRHTKSSQVSQEAFGGGNC